MVAVRGYINNGSITGFVFNLEKPVEPWKFGHDGI